MPFMYKMVHTGALPKFMQKKINEADEVKKELYNGFLNMFGIEQGGNPWITKQSIYNQFYSDLVTKVQHGIDVPGTTIHVFYATKMGKKYEKRYCTYFKNPDIRRHNMQHEELFCCHSAEWVEEVKKGSGRRQIMKEKVNVTGVPETMVQTLYARAKETKKKNAK